MILFTAAFLLLFQHADNTVKAYLVALHVPLIIFNRHGDHFVRAVQNDIQRFLRQLFDRGRQ